MDGLVTFDHAMAWRRCVRSVRLRAMRLLDLQLWCMGCDARHEPSLLLQYGFVRRRPPRVGMGGSEYARTDNVRQLTVWGYGVHLGHEGKPGVFVKRFAFAPCYTASGFFPMECWHVNAWKQVRPPKEPHEIDSTRDRLMELCDELVGYEQWVLEHIGFTYRSQCLRNWHKEALCPAGQIAQEWKSLKQSMEQLNE